MDYERGTVGVLAREESASCVVVAGGIASRDVRVGGVGCGDATSGPLSAPLKEVRLSDGTRCVYGTISGGPGGVAAVSCDWGCPR